MTELITKRLQSGDLKRRSGMIARRLLFITIGGALLAGIAFAQARLEVRSEKGPRLTGGWTTTATPPPESGAPSFKLLFTFTGDGNLLATGTGGDSPALGNPCHGVWTKTRGSSIGGQDREASVFAVTYVCLDFDSTLQFTGSDKIRGTVTINPNTGQLSGQLDLTHFDSSDNLIFSACCASLQGSRIQVEELP